MLADNKNIENLRQLYDEFKRYLMLQKKYTLLEVAEKLTILFSTLIFVLIVIILGMVALFYLSFTLAYWLAPMVGGILGSFALMSGFILLLIVVVTCFRKQLIIDPMARFIGNLFVDNQSKGKENE